MGWNPAKNDFVAKRENIDIKAKNPSDDFSLEMNRCFVVFDLVYLNGANICHKPLSERLELLQTVFTPVPGYFIMSKHIVRCGGSSLETWLNCYLQQIRTADEFLVHANRAIDKREEGLVLKQPSSHYEPDGRKGEGWYKWKPEYTGQICDDVDLLVVGGYYGFVYRDGVIAELTRGL